MKFRGLFAAVAAMFLVAAAPNYPAHQGKPVIDAAQVIPDDVEAKLNTDLTAFEKKYNNTIVVASVPSLNGDTVENYANQYFRYLGIGHKGADNGALLLWAPNERKFRIETGYQTHVYVTDMHAGRIIRNNIIPKAKAGDPVGGLVDGVAELETLMAIDPAEVQRLIKKSNEKKAADAAFDWDWVWIFLGGLTLVGGFIWWIRRKVRLENEFEDSLNNASFRPTYREPRYEAPYVPTPRRETTSYQPSPSRKSSSSSSSSSSSGSSYSSPSYDYGSSSSSSSSSSSDTGSSFGGFDGGSSGGGGASGDY